MDSLKDIYSKGAVLLDVRTVEEFQQEHIENAQLIPLDQLVQTPADLDQTKTYITYCAHGVRSQIAAQLLQQQGYSVYDGGAMPNLYHQLFE